MRPDNFPEKLSIDNLIDAFIEISFETELSERALMQKILNGEGEKYNRIPYVDQNGNRTGKYFFSDGSSRFVILEEKVGINIVGEYPGWNKYIVKIKSLISQIRDFVKFTDVRLKYVSKWKNISILGQVDGTVNFNQFPMLFNGTELSFPAKWNSDMCGYEALAKVSLKDSVIDRHESYSIVDIDLSIHLPGHEATQDNDSQADINKSTVILGIEEAHKAEKDMFFRLLSDDFINSLR